MFDLVKYYLSNWYQNVNKTWITISLTKLNLNHDIEGKDFWSIEIVTKVVIERTNDKLLLVGFKNVS